MYIYITCLVEIEKSLNESKEASSKQNPIIILYLFYEEQKFHKRAEKSAHYRQNYTIMIASTSWRKSCFLVASCLWGRSWIIRCKNNLYKYNYQLKFYHLTIGMRETITRTRDVPQAQKTHLIQIISILTIPKDLNQNKIWHFSIFHGLHIYPKKIRLSIANEWHTLVYIHTHQ